MPDGDVIPRRPVRLWKRPYDLICSGGDSDTIADGVFHSLVRSIRDKGGLPGAKDLASTVESFVGQRVTLPEALARLHAVEWQNGAHVHTRVAAEATARLLVEVSHGAAPITTPLSAVLERFCMGIIRYQLLGRRGPDQQGVQFTNYDGYLGWEHQILEPLQSRVEALVSELARDPTGRGLKRACYGPPPARPETAVMLNADLLGSFVVSREV